MKVYITSMVEVVKFNLMSRSTKYMSQQYPYGNMYYIG